MTKKFAIVLALFVISIVCCAGCIGPGDEPVDPVDPVVPVDPVDPVTPVDPVDPVEEYSVMFMLNYGDAGAYSAETVKAGETVSKPANPTRSGYTFKGWFTAAEGGAEYDFTQAVNADVTLYAQWSKKSSGSSHSHNWGTGSVTRLATCGAEGVLTYTCSCGQTKTATIPATGQHALTTDGSTVSCPICGFSYNLPAVSTDNVVLVGGQASTYDYIEDAIQKAAAEGIAEITVLSTSDSSGSSPVEVNVPEGATEVTINCQDNDVKLTYPENTDLNDIKIKADDSAEVKVKIGDTTAVILDKESTDANADYTRNDDDTLVPAAVVDSSDSTGEAYTAYGLAFLFSGGFTGALAAPVEAAPAEHIQDGWTVLFYEPAPTALGNVAESEEEASETETAWIIKLGENIDLPTGIKVHNTITLDLNGKTLSASDDTNGDGVFCVFSDGELTIIDSSEDGTGTINSASQANDYSMAIWAYGGKVTINGGTYTNDGAKAVEGNGKTPNNNELIYASNGGQITINNGFFKGNTQNKEYGTKYTLNIKDESTSTITVKGGTFVEYDPSNSASENPIANFVAEGYVAYLDEQTDGSKNWIVVEKGANVPVKTAAELQAALDNDCSVILTDDITGDVTVTQKPDVKLTIDGDGHKFAGVITIDGKSSTIISAGLTLKNIHFYGITKEKDDGKPDAYVRLGDGTDATRYVCGVTVENCIFDGTGMVAVKSYTAGSQNLLIDGCTVKTGMHSLAQLYGINGGPVVKNCFVYSKNGINLYNNVKFEMSNCKFDVQGYTVRFDGSGTNVDEIFSITGCTLKSACAETSDAVIEFKSGGVKATLTLTDTTLEGTPTFKGTTADTIIIIDEVRWSEYMYVDGEGAYCISTPEALFAFAKSVNIDGETYSGQTVKLTADIDLEDKEWTPIGVEWDDKPFTGTFDGQEKTISNLKVSTMETSVGLFGATYDATIQNVNIENVNIQGQSGVGSLAGCAYSGKVSNCHVSGNIVISGNYQVGGLVGGGYALIQGCSVIGSEYSSVTGTYNGPDFEGDSVGGIIGFTGEYSTTPTSVLRVKEVTVKNLAVSGTRKVGGVIGYLHYGVLAEDITAEKLTVSTNAASTYISDNSGKIFVGGIVGEYSGSASYSNNPSVLKNAKITDSSVIGVDVKNTGEIIGGSRGTVPIQTPGNEATKVVVTTTP